ncbi:MAG: DUF6600 domain-containing protein [Ginsengibacter sp.]
MKKSLYGVVICISILLTACAQTRNIQEPYQEAYYDEPSNSISYQQFYDDLDPYGQWVNSAEFGNVWVPRLSGFRPYYSNGNWAYTNYGWTWVSDYNWGWAPFHYGRWYYDNFYGWAWVPGYEWAPAWVNWRSNSQYYGWAPLCPQTRDGRYYETRNDQWAFVPHQYINKRNINNYYVNSQNNTTIINNTTEINNVRVINNNTKYQEGPNVAEVEKLTKARIVPLVVKQSPVPGATKVQNGTVRLFKPVVKENNIGAEKTGNSSPAKVVDTRNVPATVGKAPQTTIQTPADNRVTRKFDGSTTNNDNQVKVNPTNANNPVTKNNDKQSVPVYREITQFPNEQDQPDVRPNSNKIRSINSSKQVQQIPQENRIQQVPQEIRAQQPQQNRAPQIQQENRTRPIFVPRQSARREINQQQRVRNDQQQNPSFNQRPVRENKAPDFSRPSNPIENQPRTLPNNSQAPPRVSRVLR